MCSSAGNPRRVLVERDVKAAMGRNTFHYVRMLQALSGLALALQFMQVGSSLWQFSHEQWSDLVFEFALVSPGAFTQQDQLETLPAQEEILLEATEGLYSTALNCGSHGYELTKSPSFCVFSVLTSIQTCPTVLSSQLTVPLALSVRLEPGSEVWP